MHFSLKDFFLSPLDEFREQWRLMRSQRCSLGILLAVVMVTVIILGNVIFLLAVNFWLQVFAQEADERNNPQIAIQVVATSFVFIFFFLVSVVFACVFGLKPYYRCLFDTNRMMHPFLRFILLFASGASNAISSVLGVYSMTYTPEFLQAVLMCCIPLSAQVWSILFIAEDRKRNYLSLFFFSAFVFMVAGILLSSVTTFLSVNEDGTYVSWAWTLIYILNCVLFGLWCVVQRLYLDAAAKRTSAMAAQYSSFDDLQTVQVLEGGESVETGTKKGAVEGLRARDDSELVDERETPSGALPLVPSEVTMASMDPGAFCAEDEEEERGAPGKGAVRREWGAHSVDDNAAKLMLLVVGIFFQVLVSFVVFPVDAIPWFGTSDSVGHAWDGFSQSVIFIFESWGHVRFGLLYALGYVLSFIGCTFLNEHSPTLASVVMQLAGPITSIVILIIPQWNVYKDNGNVGHKVGGIILLVCAALCYHMWDQQSIRELRKKQALTSVSSS